VILGNIPNEGPTGGSLAMEMNDWLDAYGAGNGIQVINYSDAFCGCVGSVGSGAANWSIGSTTQPVLYGATIPVTPTTPEGGTLPTVAGYALMTELAQTAIANLTATLKSGYLQDVEYPGPDETSAGGVNVNTVDPAASCSSHRLDSTVTGVRIHSSTLALLERAALGHPATLR
jgi:hypothetical protein